MPVPYAGIIEEHRAVRERAGLFDLSHMGELFVEGPEAGAALAAALVTNPPALAVGRAHYSMICAPDGGILDDLIVYRLGQERFMVVANAGNAQVVRDALAERLDGVPGGPRRPSRWPPALVAVQGPRSVEILRPLTDVDLGALRYYAIAEGAVAGDPGARRPDRLHGRGRLRGVRRVGRAGEVWDALLDAGRAARHRAGRPGRPRHAAPRGRDAALRQRARPRAPTRSRPAWAGS